MTDTLTLREVACAYCDSSRADHGVRYVQLVGWHEYRPQNDWAQLMNRDDAAYFANLREALAEGNTHVTESGEREWNSPVKRQRRRRW